MSATDLSVVLVMEEDILRVETRAGSLSEAVSIDGRCVFCEEPLCRSLLTAIVPLRASELAEELGHGETNLEQGNRGPGILDAGSGCFVL